MGHLKNFLPPGDEDPFQYVSSELPPGATDGFFHTSFIPGRLYELSGGAVSEALRTLTDALTVLFTSIHVENSPSNKILTQAFNDAVDLCTDIQSGRGRPAALLARVIFEHLVNYCTVEDDHSAAERYLGSEAVGADLMFKNFEWLAANFDLPAAVPDPKRRAATAERLAEVIQAHGVRIKGSTFIKNLFVRAQGAGYETDYEGYRFLSQAVHGTAGGAEGLSVVYKDSPVVHRLGPSLLLAPIAYRWGFTWTQSLIKEFTKRRQNVATSNVLQAVDDVLAKLPDYYLAVAQLDAEIQPRALPRDPEVLALAIVGKNGVNWYAFYPHSNTRVARLPTHATGSSTFQAFSCSLSVRHGNQSSHCASVERTG